MYGLERVELRSTDLFRRCPTFDGSSSSSSGYNPGSGGEPRQADGDNRSRCSGNALIYRTADGTCNNLRRTDWGSSFTPFLRKE